MPTNEASFLFQTAVYWPCIGYDNYGQSIVGPPIELSPNTSPPTGVRWLTKRREVLQKDGTTIALDATAIVSTVVIVGSHMWLGTLDEWYGPAGTGSGSGSGASDDELFYVHNFNLTPDVKARQSLKTVDLMRLHSKNAPG